MPPKTTLIKIGDFFFKYRNALFPLMLIALFLCSPPPSEYFGQEWLEEVVDGLALIMVLLGLGLRGAVIGYRYIKRGGLSKKVYADDLVTDGFFAVCRNPLYVGNMLINVGILVKQGSPFVILVGTAFFVFVYTAIIAAEEYFLRNKFGAAYDAYCADVPRWWMKWSRLKHATEGMKFNFSRVLAKDYSTIMNVAITMIALEMWEEINEAHRKGMPVEWTMLAALILCIVIAGGIVRYMKKSGKLSA